MKQAIFLKFLNVFLFTVTTFLFLLHTEKATVFQELFLSGLMAALFLLPYEVITKGRRWRIQKPALYVLRSLLSLIGMATLVASMALLGPNLAIALNYLSPVFALLLATVFLKEQITPLRSGAIAVCLMGTCLMIPIQPSWSMLYGIGLGLLSAVIWAGHDIICKRQTLTEDPVTQVFFTFLLCALISAPFAWAFWRPLDLADYGFLAGISVIRIANLIMLFAAYQLVPMALLMPINYSRLVLTAIGSYFIFGHVLTLFQCLGSAVILIALSYQLWHEQSRPLPCG